MRTVRVAVLALLLAPHAAFADSLPLPKPTGEIPVVREAFPDRPDRLRTSIVPGAVDDTERVEVLVGPDGTPAAVSMHQRLVLHGTGQFIVWERSSAQDVEALEDTVAPVLKREAVVWQGFVDGSKPLVARLTLDPLVEAELLPLQVTVTWNGPGTIAPGGGLPGPGEVTVRISNRTSRPTTLPTGTVSPTDIAKPLDALRRHAARRTNGTPPPMAGRGLPKTLTATGAGTREATTVAPFRIDGTIRANGGTPVTPESGAVSHLADGLRVGGVLQGDVEFTVRVNAAATLALDLTAYPTLDPRLLQPPRGSTWADWLRLGPTPAETAAALTQLVEGAAAAARADEYAPYLGHHGPGKVRTTYVVRMAPAEVVPQTRNPLRPKAFPIALASFAMLAIVANTTAIWRRL